jgi:hypothetical protein
VIAIHAGGGWLLSPAVALAARLPKTR